MTRIRGQLESIGITTFTAMGYGVDRWVGDGNVTLSKPDGQKCILSFEFGDNVGYIHFEGDLDEKVFIQIADDLVDFIVSFDNENRSIKSFKSAPHQRPYKITIKGNMEGKWGQNERDDIKYILDGIHQSFAHMHETNFLPDPNAVRTKSLDSASLSEEDIENIMTNMTDEHIKKLVEKISDESIKKIATHMAENCATRQFAALAKRVKKLNKELAKKKGEKKSSKTR